MNTRFVETFLTLARLGSFRATATAMHATPAAISLRIKTLESELGVELIERDAPEFKLTANGERLLAHAADTGATVFAAHFAETSAGTVRRVEKGFEWRYA